MKIEASELVIILLAVFIVLLLIRAIFIRRRKKPYSKATTDTRTNVPSHSQASALPHPNRAKLDQLAKLSWKSQESLQNQDFILLPSDIGSSDLSKVMEIILNHVRRIAPGLSVPYFVPRVQTGTIFDTAGQFIVETGGWVSINLATNFLSDRQAALAILVHEACHYILENSGIRETDNLQNERMTDLCIFICGLGKIYLQGYKKEIVQNEYRRGHRLGYLTDGEYQFADNYVLELRRNNVLGLPSKLQELKQQLTARIADSRVRDRLVTNARQKYPGKDEAEIYGLVMDQLERDRR
jgi:hypothetical protein